MMINEMLHRSGRQVRKPAVAGQFYPGERDVLIDALQEYFISAKNESDLDEVHVNALIAPHAGYMFSGKQAAKAYACLRKDVYRLACIISPSHREYFPAISVYPGDAYETPLGICNVDHEAREIALSCEGFVSGFQGHRTEHALEVQLPFLQFVLGDLPILPMVMGDQSSKTVMEGAACIKKLYENYGNDILFIVSSDLSHFHSAEAASTMDAYLMDILEKADADMFFDKLQVDEIEACGGGPIVSIMKGLNIVKEEIRVLGYSHSGEVLKDNDSVVGYTSAIMIKGNK